MATVTENMHPFEAAKAAGREPYKVADLALGELLEYDGIVLVEWGDVVAGAFGDHLEVRFDLDPDDEDARDVTLSATGRSWALRWERIEASVEAFAC